MSESTTDDYLRLLAHRSRRRILAPLVGQPSTAVRLADCLDGNLDSGRTLAEYERHLEKLERADVVTYDASQRTVSQGPAFDRIEPFVRAVASAETPRDAERERDQIALVVHALGHDLRNTFTTIQARASLLAERDTDADHHAVIESQIEASLSRLTTLEAFTDTVVDDGAHELAEWNVRETLMDELDSLRTLHPNATVTGETLPDVTVRADDRLPLVFENVLRNAVEHNDRDLPTVTASGSCDDELVTITIADDGPGIPDDRTDALRDAGVTGPESDGNGFGLHFVTRTIDAYDGEFTIEDREPRGTAARIRLPRVRHPNETVSVDD